MSQNRKTYDFASVGETQVEFQNRLVDPALNLPIGIKTPLELSYGSSGPFKMRTDLGKQIRDNFLNMLSTNYGDRLMLTDFGANLEELAFELGSEGGDLQAVARIKRTTQKYMPFINLDTFEPITEKDGSGSTLAKVGVRVTYSVPSIDLRNQVVEVIIYSGG